MLLPQGELALPRCVSLPVSILRLLRAVTSLNVGRKTYMHMTYVHICMYTVYVCCIGVGTRGEKGVGMPSPRDQTLDTLNSSGSQQWCMKL